MTPYSYAEKNYFEFVLHFQIKASCFDMPNFLKIIDVEKLKKPIANDEDQKEAPPKKEILASFNCDKCSMVFSKADHFTTNHRSTEGYKNNKPKKCNQCDYTACTNTGIRLHVKKIHATKIQIACREANCCHLCGKIFTENTNLTRHHKSVHERIKQWKCPKCPKTYKRGDDLKRHWKKWKSHEQDKS